MDYSEDFRLVQATLNYCNEFVKKFDQIIYYGGEITEKLKGGKILNFKIF